MLINYQSFYIIKEKLRFIWKISTPVYSDQCDVEAKCGNVVTQGVPFPDRWKTACKCLSLHQQVENSAIGAMQFGISKALN